MLKRLTMAAIRFYSLALSPYLPTFCRFQPTCSNYSHQAIERYGAFRGGWLTVKRLGRCRPMGGKGYDPVP